MVQSRFNPFYEKISELFPVPFAGKACISILPGFVFLTLHFLAVQEKVFKDWSWLLCLLIVTAMACLYYATHTLQSIFPSMDLLNEGGDSNVYLKPLKKQLSDRRLLGAGIFFGVVNCIVAFVLGPPYTEAFPKITIYIGYFLAGFVCGMAVWCIRGVVITLNRYLNKGELRLDYSHPDECGGMLFLGDALIKFSTVTLIVGVLITAYILWGDWENLKFGADEAQKTYIRASMWLWICFPFLASVTILFSPATIANHLLMRHKVEMQVELKLEYEKAKSTLEKQTQDASRQEQLLNEYEFYLKRRASLHAMKNWPFNTATNVKFVILFISNALVTFRSIMKFLGG